MGGFFNEYPYTDFHELNLDWVIKKVKELINDWMLTRAEWQSTKEEFEELKSFINDYFANLDVQEEINNKLDEMYESGELDFIFSKFINTTLLTKRYFSYSGSYGFQFGVYTGNSFLFFNGVSSSIKITELNTQGAYITEYTIDYEGHPNGGWIKDDKIYIVMSSSKNILVLDLDTKEILETVTLDIQYDLIGGCIYDNDGYISTYMTNEKGQFIYKLNDEFEVEEIGACLYDANTYPVTLIPQNFIIYKNKIHFLFNQPNIVLIYNLSDCAFNQQLTFADGDGMFPHGEIESFVLFDDKLYISSGIYYYGDNRQSFTSELFETSLYNNEMIQSRQIGQLFRSHDVLYVDASSTDTNPTGTATHKFSSLAEACMVYQYRQSHNHNVIGLNITTGSYIDGIQLTNCSVEILGGGALIYNISLYNVNGMIRSIKTNNDTSNEVRNCNLFMRSIEGTTSCTIINSKVFLFACENNISTSHSEINGKEYNLSNVYDFVFTSNNLEYVENKNFNKTTACNYYYPETLNKILDILNNVKLSFAFGVDNTYMYCDNVEFTFTPAEYQNIKNNVAVSRRFTISFIHNSQLVNCVVAVMFYKTFAQFLAINSYIGGTADTSINDTINILGFDYTI